MESISCWSCAPVTVEMVSSAAAARIVGSRSQSAVMRRTTRRAARRGGAGGWMREGGTAKCGAAARAAAPARHQNGFTTIPVAAIELLLLLLLLRQRPPWQHQADHAGDAHDKPAGSRNGVGCCRPAASTHSWCLLLAASCLYNGLCYCCVWPPSRNGLSLSLSPCALAGE